MSHWAVKDTEINSWYFIEYAHHNEMDIYIYIYLCQMVCSKTLSYVIWHIPSHSFGSRSDLEKFYVKWSFPGQSWKTNVRTYRNYVRTYRNYVRTNDIHIKVVYKYYPTMPNNL